MGQIALRQGERAGRDILSSESIQLSQEMGDRRNMVRTRLLLASLALTQGNVAAPVPSMKRAWRLALELGVDWLHRSRAERTELCGCRTGTLHHGGTVMGSSRHLSGIPQRVPSHRRLAERAEPRLVPTWEHQPSKGPWQRDAPSRPLRRLPHTRPFPCRPLSRVKASNRPIPQD